jgi:hypothetical protein
MTKKIMQHLMENNSYFKWSATRLAEKFGCSERTVTNAIGKLTKVKTQYFKNLAK